MAAELTGFESQHISKAKSLKSKTFFAEKSGGPKSFFNN
jgi:hypothetical protein